LRPKSKKTDRDAFIESLLKDFQIFPDGVDVPASDIIDTPPPVIQNTDNSQPVSRRYLRSYSMYNNRVID
jgi:hypothetical protein